MFWLGFLKKKDKLTVTEKDTDTEERTPLSTSLRGRPGFLVAFLEAQHGLDGGLPQLERPALGKDHWPKNLLP